MSSVSSKSSSSSSLESLKENSSLNYGLQPYVHEPTVSGKKKQVHYGNIESSSSDSNDEVETRIGNTEWCTCGSCQKMETSTESVCCREMLEINDERFQGIYSLAINVATSVFLS